MDCPNCGVYNPEERTICWRCDKPLPKKVEQKKRQLTSQHWLYIIIAVSAILMLANMCGLPGLSTMQIPPEGLFLPFWLGL